MQLRLCDDLNVNLNYEIVYVVVQFYLWFKFYFPLVLDMVKYDNAFETKETKI